MEQGLGKELSGWEEKSIKAHSKQGLQWLKNLNKTSCGWFWMSSRCLCSHPDAPMFISHPHFYNADPSLLNAVEGLQPSKDKHGLFLDIHPVSLEPAGVLAPPRGLSLG